MREQIFFYFFYSPGRVFISRVGGQWLFVCYFNYSEVILQIINFQLYHLFEQLKVRFR